nr:type IV pilus biogenesis/stability protein PilW [Solimonas marina]
MLALAGCATPAERSEKLRLAQINTQLGVNYAREGQYEVAIEKLQAAVKAQSSYGPAHSALAVIYQTRGEMDAAEKEYRRALSLDGSDSTLKNNFGVFLCKRGKRDEAQRYFKQVVRDPRYLTPEEAWTNAGVCIKPKSTDEAERDFRKALQLRASYRPALAQMALLSYEQQDFLRARAFLQRYDLSISATPELLGVAARTEFALGDKDGARSYAQRIVRDFPESKEAEQFADWQP